MSLGGAGDRKCERVNRFRSDARSRIPASTFSIARWGQLVPVNGVHRRALSSAGVQLAARLPTNRSLTHRRSLRARIHSAPRAFAACIARVTSRGHRADGRRCRIFSVESIVKLKVRGFSDRALSEIETVLAEQSGVSDCPRDRARARARRHSTNRLRGAVGRRCEGTRRARALGGVARHLRHDIWKRPRRRRDVQSLRLEEQAMRSTVQTPTFPPSKCASGSSKRSHASVARNRNASWRSVAAPDFCCFESRRSASVMSASMSLRSPWSWFNVRRHDESSRRSRCARSKPKISMDDDDDFDAVIINSVVQCFPNVDYLRRVLCGAARKVRRGGVIFVGDVRHMGLFEAFATSVELARAADNDDLETLRERIARQMETENERLFAAIFFGARDRARQGDRAEAGPRRQRAHTISFRRDDSQERDSRSHRFDDVARLDELTRDVARGARRESPGDHHSARHSEYARSGGCTRNASAQRVESNERR